MVDNASTLYIEDDDEISGDFAIYHKWLDLHYSFRYNIVANVIESRKKPKGNAKAEAWKEINENNILFEMNMKNFKCTAEKLSIILGSDFVPKYDPFKEYFESLKPYDTDENEGKSNYIEQLAFHFTIKESDSCNRIENQIRFYHMLRKHMVRIIAGAINDNFISKHCFIIIGEKQNPGKTWFCRWLCPPQLKPYFTENISIDKDSMIALCDNIIINLDELSTLSKYDLNALKTSFSKDYVKVRPPYGRKAIRMKRRATFIGNTNNLEFLNDPTGSVRWICFEVAKINKDYYTDINIDDIYREAYYLYKSGKFNYNLTEEELQHNEKANNAHFMITAEMEVISKLYEPCEPRAVDGVFLQTTDIRNKILEKTLFKDVSHKAVGVALKKMGFIQVSGRVEHDDTQKELFPTYSVKGYWVKEKPDKDAPPPYQSL